MVRNHTVISIISLIIIGIAMKAESRPLRHRIEVAVSMESSSEEAKAVCRYFTGNIIDALNKGEICAAVSKSEEADSKTVTQARYSLRCQVEEYEQRRITRMKSSGKDVTPGDTANALVEIKVSLYDNYVDKALKELHVSKSSQGTYGIGKSKDGPLSQAAAEAVETISQAVNRELKPYTWESRVIMVKDNLVYISAGRRDGVDIGTRLEITASKDAVRIAEDTEPGRYVKIKDVSSNYAYAQLSGLQFIAAGDRVCLPKDKEPEIIAGITVR
ncbi:MAG: hypothetical protein WC074_06895 [bacterium]